MMLLVCLSYGRYQPSNYCDETKLYFPLIFIYRINLMAQLCRMGPDTLIFYTLHAIFLSWVYVFRRITLTNCIQTLKLIIKNYQHLVKSRLY